ncbi:hypothetical protein P0136_02960 [Lentisphaerota bacterium ZTH]|nr:hypothetical protein JYG24_05900 [Lentisphaerota bacterium]WET06962.1 hypothetical protein P0136_02960 [Lentisphaerota bacterium ZTH]
MNLANIISGVIVLVVAALIIFLVKRFWEFHKKKKEFEEIERRIPIIFEKLKEASQNKYSFNFVRYKAWSTTADGVNTINWEVGRKKFHPEEGSKQIDEDIQKEFDYITSHEYGTKTNEEDGYIKITFTPKFIELFEKFSNPK